ncbi:hypothetical protein L208DRAFT_1311721, partial [Tricholoma matsutake]
VTTQVKQLQLVHDMKVRWDSLYFMINQFCKLHPAIEYFLSLPVNRELAKLRLTDMEWTVLQDFEMVLGVPHQVQQIMSTERTPMLLGAIPAFEMFMTAWELLGENHPRLAQWMDIGIQWATTYYKKMDDSHAYVIMMCELKFRFIHHLIT